jgi:hypothetical protein
MPYLILQDYYSSIQDANLQQVLASVDAYRLTKQATALEEIKSYLVQKYDISQEFKETLKYSYTATYNARQLVYLDADAFSHAGTYALNAVVVYTGNVYYCKLAVVTPGVFSLTNWTLLGPQYSFYYIPLPYPEFDYTAFYAQDDIVFWENKVYTCLKPTVVPIAQQYDTYSKVPFQNQFPGIKVDQWSAGVPYSVSGLWPTAIPGDFTAWSNVTIYTTGQRVYFNSIIYQAQANSTNIEPCTDITKWLPVSFISGDNRNPQLVELNVHIAIYKLSTRISPRNIPDIWVKNYDDAIKWLKNAARGNDITANLPMKQPDQGFRTRWGGHTKQQNTY